MSYADKVFKEHVKDILENGVWDTERKTKTSMTTIIAKHARMRRSYGQKG